MSTPPTSPQPVAPEVLARIAAGAYHDPHEVLGAHPGEAGTTVRVLRHLASAVTIVTEAGSRVPLTHEQDGIWVGVAETPGDYDVETTYEDGSVVTTKDGYRRLPTLGELDLHLIREGRHERLWDVLGAHLDDGGARFSVWAPNAQAVRVIGDFNSWEGRASAMRSLGGSGVWELYVPGVWDGAVYKFQILTPEGYWVDKADPMARRTEVPPATGSVVTASAFEFTDDEWMASRAEVSPAFRPMSTYEVHLGSWRPGLSYRELATALVDYVRDLQFTHVEFLPVAEHPFGGSWGYQVTSYYAPTSRFGTPDEFKYLVDRLHAAGIGVIMDWVPAHFPKDSFALAAFDGRPLYEHPDPLRGEHPDWGTLIFDYGRNEVRNFLVANALYWVQEFHIDGLRVDAVASMLYLDYSREDGQWRPNEHGGNENLDAIRFIQEVNATVGKVSPGVAMIAEESTAFPGVTSPTSGGGLGFTLKWNMGWMHDTLDYVAYDPMYRNWHHNQLTFSLVYAFSEKYVLPISHDEVVHGKGSLLTKFPGDRWQQLAGLRGYLAFQWAHPGKQLIFMGTEFGQEAEWSEAHGLDWWLAEDPQHEGVQRLVADLNGVYATTPALYERDQESTGFQWLDGADASRSVISFVRWDVSGRPLVCLVNFAGTDWYGYTVPLPQAGRWVETLNTAAESYGGSGVGNMGTVEATEGGFNGFDAQATLVLPAYGTIYLTPESPAAGES